MRAHKKLSVVLAKGPRPWSLGQEGQEGTGHSCILLDIASLGPLPKKAGVNGFCISPLSGKA